jgi:tRNA A-37 threonylcarbamoyl transferase component Bud32
MTDWNTIDLATIRQHSITTYRKAHGSRPDVLLINIDGNEAVLKDYSYSDTWFRRLIAPLLVIREVRSLKMLDGVAGVPRLYHVYNRLSFLVESVNGIAASQMQKNSLDNDFFERMNKVLDDVHEKGVTHCDLRSAGNTLITADHQPWLVDFVASIHQSPRWNFVGRWIFEQFVEADYGAVLKLKNRLAPQHLTAEELDLILHPHSVVERIGRKMGRSVRFVTRNLFPSKKS